MAAQFPRILRSRKAATPLSSWEFFENRAVLSEKAWFCLPETFWKLRPTAATKNLFALLWKEKEDDHHQDLPPKRRATHMVMALWKSAPEEEKNDGHDQDSLKKGLVHTLWHKTVTYKKVFWNNDFRKITDLMRNPLKMSFFPGHFESTNCLQDYEK